MLKTGFRGERKRILTPSLSQGEGNVVTENQKKPPPYTYPAFAGFLGEGECGDGKRKK